MLVGWFDFCCYSYEFYQVKIPVFPGSRAGESGLKSDSEAVNDALVVHGFSVGYKAEFTDSVHFPRSGRLLLFVNINMQESLPAGLLPIVRDFTCYLVLLAAVSRHHNLPTAGI